MKIRPMIVLAAITAAFAAPVAAETQTWRVGATYVVRASGLNLASPEDQAALLLSVESAAERVCRDRGSPWAKKACRVEAIEGALRNATPRMQRALQLASARQHSTVLAKHD